MFSCFKKSQKEKHGMPIVKVSPPKAQGSTESLPFSSKEHHEPSIKEILLEEKKASSSLKKKPQEKEINEMNKSILKGQNQLKTTESSTPIGTELISIESDLKSHYEEIEQKMTEEFQILERVVVGELRKARLQVKMNIKNELEIHLLNLNDIKSAMRTSTDDVRNSIEKVATARRSRVSSKAMENWSQFYSYFLENKKEMLNLISCNCNFVKAQSSFIAEFEKTLKVCLLESFEKSRLFLSELLSNFSEGLKDATPNLSQSGRESSSRMIEEPMTDNIKQSLLDGEKQIELQRITKLEKTFKKGEEKKLKAPIILNYTEDICFSSEQDQFINLMEFKTNKLLWRSPDLGAEVLDICCWSPAGVDSVAAILNNNYMVWGAVQITENFTNVTIQPSVEIQIDYSSPHSLVGVRGLGSSSKVLVCASNGACCVYDFGSHKTLQQLQIGPNLKRLSCLAFVQNSEFIAFGSGSLKASNDNLISVYSIKNILNESFIFNQHHCFTNCHELPNGVISIASLNKKDSPLVFSTGFGSMSIKIWNVALKEKVASLPVEETVFQICIVSIHDSVVAFAYTMKNFVFLAQKNNCWELRKFKAGRAKGSVRKSLVVSQDSHAIFIFASNLFGEIEFHSIRKN